MNYFIAPNVHSILSNMYIVYTNWPITEFNLMNSILDALIYDTESSHYAFRRRFSDTRLSTSKECSFFNYEYLD